MFITSSPWIGVSLAAHVRCGQRAPSARRRLLVVPPAFAADHCNRGADQRGNRRDGAAATLVCDRRRIEREATVTERRYARTD